MRARRLIAGALFLALAPAAAAQSGPPPELRTFDDVVPGTPVSAAYGPSPLITPEGDCGASVVEDPDPSGSDDLAARGTCGTYRIAFDDPQAHVSLRAWTASFSLRAAAALAPATLSLEVTRGEGTFAPDTKVGVDEATWIPLTVRSRDGRPTIDEVTVTSDEIEFAIDDLLFATTPQPDTTIGGGPGAATASREAAFALGSSVAGSAFECSLDGAPFRTCAATPSYSGLADGPHSLRARARDTYGNVDSTPARRAWTVAQPPRSDADADGDGVPASRDNCPDASNRSQADEDRDDVGNTCELLPSGTIRPVAGVRTRVEALSGTVLIKLPVDAASARAAQLPPGFVPLKGTRRIDTPPEPTFVPLEGVATVPIGSTIDSRKGRMAVTTATAYTPPGSRRRSPTKTGRFAAAIFTIKQARRRSATPAREPSTDLVLRTPPGLARACAANATLPPKGIVRALSGAVSGPRKGRFRAVGAASVTTVQRGTWITQDRCNGTLTEVGRGRATVQDRGRHRTVTVGPGRAYLARARLFAAKRRRAAGS